jgi:hypothetical protein
VMHAFENQKGYQRVKSRLYLLEDHVSNTKLDVEGPFTLRRGMKINMSMIFFGDNGQDCPRCQSRSDAEIGRYVHW